MLAVVCDASPLIYLSRLEQFRLLQRLYDTVLIPPAVWQEVGVAGAGFPEATELKAAVEEGWIRVEGPVGPKSALDPFVSGLGQGEVEAILLARERKAVLITDDALGRSAAERLGMDVTGTIGVLLRAKKHGKIASLRPLLDRLKTQTNFRISTKVLGEALKAAGEG